MNLLKLYVKKKILFLVLPFLILLLITFIYFGYECFYILFLNNLQFYVDPDKVIFETDIKFLSVALDSSFMGCMFHQLDEGGWKKLEKLSKLLSPAFLRLGGTAADQTIFSLSENNVFIKNHNCSDIQPNETIIITSEDWMKINQFARNSGFSFIIDLNVLLRSGSEWNSSNSKSLIDFSEQNGFQLDFQLGNEPNSFPHVFNVNVSGAQLANDFNTLRSILKSTKAYQKSKLIGPDITRPKIKNSRSLPYLKEFLKQDVVDVVSWHQYYLNGRTATLQEFVDPKTFDFFLPQAASVAKTVRKFFPSKPIWLSETSSAYGGGAPELSDRFAASFLWLDKLGTAARSGISVVIRQTLFEKFYALITDDFSPTPDFWISLLYKKLVGTRVLDLTSNKSVNGLRLYAHCLAAKSGVNGSIVIYGLNLNNESKFIDIPHLSVEFPILAYIFKAELNNLKAKSVLLNDNLLVYSESEIPDLVNLYEEVKLPFVLDSYSIGFWVLKTEETACGLLLDH